MSQRECQIPDHLLRLLHVPAFLREYSGEEIHLVPPEHVFQEHVDEFSTGVRDIAIREEWRNQEDFHGSS